MNIKLRIFAEFIWAFLASLNVLLAPNIYSRTLWFLVMLLAFVVGTSTVLESRRKNGRN
jgi:hypothetical protein